MRKNIFKKYPITAATEKDCRSCGVMRQSVTQILFAIVATGWLWIAAYEWIIPAIYDPGPILELNNPPAAVLNNPVYPGSGLIVKWYGKKVQDCPGQGESWIYFHNDPDQASVSLRSNTLKRPVGPITSPVLYPLPPWLPPGDYDLYSRIQYNCGIKPQTQLLPLVRFTVRGRDG